eukprot:TRINITY_DN102747_c0_g1_i1.p1 TRINITY_DN102747_c0_g1~~TRINITY_DN102747_c0_g1_i1.p1  ORF type:complete len:183 (-),score=37.02 TRINITY_DN102747_c0_g1_i1:546-1094(-)
MATPMGIFAIETTVSKPDDLDEYARFEVDTEPPTDDDSDDEEFSFSHHATDRTDASVEVHCGDVSDVEALETNIQEHISAGRPLWLALDMDDTVQVMQETKLVLPSALARGDGDSSIVPKRVFPKRPPGVFFPASTCSSADSSPKAIAQKKDVIPKMPPGVFFRPPPGLPPPDFLVQGLSAA